MANERPEYRTLHPIPDPVNAGRTAYHGGELIHAQVVRDWELAVGVDVEPARPDALPRPAGNASRSEWATYRLSQGMPPDEVDAMTRGQLRDADADGGDGGEADSNPAESVEEG